MDSLSTLTLLCVEDNKTTQILYDSIFEDLIDTIIFAYDGEEGYQKYLDNEIDIIITDYDMPKLNGLDMSQQIRLENKDVPIILSTAIDSIDIIAKSIKIGINNFVQKPIDATEIIKSVEDAYKIILANKIIQEQKDKDLKKLQEKESYSSYQEDLGFKKELNILRNDFYYQMLDYNGISLVDFLYQPLDVMSGDAYTARRIDEHSTFYLMVDGMGKGLSASLTAMIMTSFVNHVFDKMTMGEENYFDLGILIHETMAYIKNILLDEEALAIDYVVIDNEENMMYYAKFAMPVTLMQNNQNEIIRLKSNNPPLCKWSDTFNTSAHDISDITKLLIYSDGIVENETIYDNQPYSEFIEKDFLNSFTREDLKHSFFEKAKEQEDDLTLIYIHKLDLITSQLSTQSFNSSLADIDKASEWYDEIWATLTDDIKISYGASVVFTELYMNALEHGNLGINSATKHKLLDEDTYFETIAEMEKSCTKKIKVRVNKIEHIDTDYIITQITDEGEGFDTQILSEIFRNSVTFNGRGVFVSRKNSLGIYYNAKGNSVLYLNKIEKV